MDKKYLIGSELFVIDLTPTYCMLLGIPIPANNLAMIISDYFLNKPNIVDDFVIANNFYTNFR